MTSRLAERIFIDKNVPLPTPRAQNAPQIGGSHGIYPWAEMVPGDSFFVPGATTNGGALGKGLRHMSTSRGRQVVPGSEWACRAVAKGGVRGVRVWRVK
jgi:hypothetical protein